MQANEPWYSNGLRFTCTRCGTCCTGGPGSVRVTDLEILKLARRLALAEVEFRRYYTYRLGNGDMSLREKSNLDCIFHEKDKGCSVYEDRPRQCRTWPFWGKNVDSRRTWKKSARWCKGMNSGRLHPLQVIEDLLSNDGTTKSD